MKGKNTAKANYSYRALEVAQTNFTFLQSVFIFTD